MLVQLGQVKARLAGLEQENSSLRREVAALDRAGSRLHHTATSLTSNMQAVMELQKKMFKVVS